MTLPHHFMHCITWIGDYGRKLEAQGKQFRLLLRNYDEFASVFITHGLLGREVCCCCNWEVVLQEHEMLEVIEQTAYEMVFRSSCCEQQLLY